MSLQHVLILQCFNYLGDHGGGGVVAPGASEVALAVVMAEEVAVKLAASVHAGADEVGVVFTTVRVNNHSLLAVKKTELNQMFVSEK